MNKKTLLALLPLLPLLLTACSDGFPDEEMHLGLEDKVRPYAVVLDPPEASPGETVQVTLYAHVPAGKTVDIRWQVALDYNTGLYETDETERHFLPVGQDAVITTDGPFLTQSFSWTVPDSVLRVSSAVPEVLVDPVLTALAQLVIGPEAGTPPTRAGVENWILSGLHSIPMNAETEALVDRFSCAVRFRASLETAARTVDVTRNLTVRYSRRLDSSQVNQNNTTTGRRVVALEKQDATPDDLGDQSLPRHDYPLQDSGLANPVEVPYHAGWTYFLVEAFERQVYNAPFEPGLMVNEELEGRWYYYRHDEPTSPDVFLRNDDGEDPEMWELDDEIVLEPAGPGTRYALISVIRDTRRDWRQYHLAPGQSVYRAELLFRTP